MTASARFSPNDSPNPVGWFHAAGARWGRPGGGVPPPPGAALDRMLVSTHGLPISFFLDRLESAARETVIIGIEPADLSFGEGLSTEVNAAVEWLVGVLTAGSGDIESVAVLDGIGGPEERPGEPLE